MNRKPVTYILSAAEAAVYDSRDDQAGAELRATIDCRAVEIIDAGGVSSVTVNHPDGFTVWHYDVSDLRANGGAL